MKYLSIILITIVLIAGCGKTPESAAVTSLNTWEDSVSYSIGVDIGSNFNRQGIEVNPDVLHQGFKDGYSEGEMLLTQEEIMNVIKAEQMNFRKRQDEQRQKQLEEDKKVGDENLKASEAFLAENAEKEGIVVMPSGLQYKVLKLGTGARPKNTDKVQVHYIGKLIDGTVFDSSIERGQPATFNVNRVVKGWTEALQLMQVGAKWELYIPPKLGYGPTRRPTIPPNSALIFEVELLSIQ